MSEREASPSSEKERYLSHLEQNWDWDEAVKKLEGGKELTESGALFLGNVNDFVPPGGNHKMADFFEALSDIGSRHGGNARNSVESSDSGVTHSTTPFSV